MREPTAGTDRPSDPAHTEYRVAHLRERLAAEDLAELGVRADVRGGTVRVTGTVPSAECREALLRTVREELSGLAVQTDVVVAGTSSPERAEDLP
ncbi:BON domain-containing protein [Streptomyces sp. NPDC091281]|uniref:BON domain-containing protein n=1 Tax=Streptomyces sp. NPDC091281 TaxID=3365985 RepID=UPI00381DF11C